MAVLKGPNADGSSSFQLAMTRGVFVAGPNAGLGFTISNFVLRGWSGSDGVKTYGSSASPVIQTVSLAEGTKFQRICTMLIVLISALR